MFTPTQSRIIVASAVLAVAAGRAAGHEAWLLTPAEIEALAVAPVPWLFTSQIIMGLAALLAFGAMVTALVIEPYLQPIEDRIAATARPLIDGVGPLVLRLGLAAMLFLAGTGGLPRHGITPWTEPTYFVPDMQLSLIAGWDWLAEVQIALAILLALGLGTRVLGAVLIAASAAGLGLFGAPFLSYAPHFAAPGLVLILLGGGTWSVDGLMSNSAVSPVPANWRQPLWRAAQILFGAGFVYLAVMFKLTQPTLLIAILDHAQFPSFGLPYAAIALVMTWVEILCGVLLIMGRMVRPVSLVIIGAITFLAITLGETPLFHANLYGTMLAFALVGRHLSWAAQPAPTSREILA